MTAFRVDELHFCCGIDAEVQSDEGDAALKMRRPCARGDMAYPGPGSIDQSVSSDRLGGVRPDAHDALGFSRGRREGGSPNEVGFLEVYKMAESNLY